VCLCHRYIRNVNGYPLSVIRRLRCVQDVAVLRFDIRLVKVEPDHFSPSVITIPARAVRSRSARGPAVAVESSSRCLRYLPLSARLVGCSVPQPPPGERLRCAAEFAPTALLHRAAARRLGVGRSLRSLLGERRDCCSALRAAVELRRLLVSAHLKIQSPERPQKPKPTRGQAKQSPEKQARLP